jgi:hypothetical protein
MIISDYPHDQVMGASGGLLSNNIALICGGYQWPEPSKMYDDCNAITDNAGIEAKVKLTQPRSGGASVVLNGSILWITGQ